MVDRTDYESWALLRICACFVSFLASQQHKMTTKLIWYSLFVIEVVVLEGVYLFYLEVGVGWMHDLQ